MCKYVYQIPPAGDSKVSEQDFLVPKVQFLRSRVRTKNQNLAEPHGLYSYLSTIDFMVCHYLFRFIKYCPEGRKVIGLTKTQVKSYRSLYPLS